MLMFQFTYSTEKKQAVLCVLPSIHGYITQDRLKKPVYVDKPANAIMWCSSSVNCLTYAV